MEYMEENDKIHLSSMQQLQEARDRDDDWTGVTSREERRKRQNRLNQRAARSFPSLYPSKLCPIILVHTLLQGYQVASYDYLH